MKKTVDQYLDEVDYGELNNGSYVPSAFALQFAAFIKLVNKDVGGESNKTPVFHLKMLDSLIDSGDLDVVTLCFRGSGKTTVFAEYLILYIAVFGEIPNIGKITFMIYVSDSINNGVKSLKENIEARFNNSTFLQEWLVKTKFIADSLKFVNKEGRELNVRMYGAESGIRGGKRGGKRPNFAIIDDIIGDNDAASKAVMDKIRDTIQKGIPYALDTKSRKILFLGTPFHQEDVIYKAVESGGWKVNVFPVCEKFPCTREEFRGAWEDRFTYDFIKTLYDKAEAENGLPGFYQELMLRISDGSERLVRDSDIRWYNKKTVIDNINNFNIYITTDFATSAKDTADNSVISVWAISGNGDYFWLEGICKRQRLSQSMSDLFALAKKYKDRLQGVGVEANGTQNGFLDYILDQQIAKNVFFDLCREKGKDHIGIKSNTDKFKRFNNVLHLFTNGKMYFPLDQQHEPVLTQFMKELKSVTLNGIKSKDDCLDTISMLSYINIIVPTITNELVVNDSIYSIFDKPIQSYGGTELYAVD